MNTLRQTNPAFLFLTSLFASFSLAAEEVVLERVESEDVNFRVVRVVGDLERPWSMEFLPGDKILITERPGRMQLFEQGSLTEIEGLPEIRVGGQGGLLDVVKHPGFEENSMIYFSYSKEYDGGVGTVVSRAILDGHRLVDREEIFRMQPPGRGGAHFGCRLIFDDEGYLYISLGDRGDRYESQNLGSSVKFMFRPR